MITTDANQAVADVAYRVNEVIAIYPITPASPMGEHADAWAARGRLDIWGTVPHIVEMQSEGGAAGAVHGALQAGALTTTFTASQGLLLMLPNMYKIAGELTPCVIHVAARSLATHALSIFADHSDVYAARQTGFAMLCANSVQQAQDFAAISHAVTLRARVPFLHFFDGFRTSHEIAKIDPLTDDHLRALLDHEAISLHRARALSPERPVIRGTAQNPDAFFQAREAVSPFYERTPEIVRQTMARFAELTGRRYDLIEYVGHPQAERVVVLMGSGAECAAETVEYLAREHDERVGAVMVHLYRPFPVADFMAALPDTVERIAVLDRTKEPGAPGDPLYLDVVAAVHQSRQGAGQGARPTSYPMIIGGRYGLSSKEFTPAMVKGVLDALAGDSPRHGFTVGIVDDVSHSSINYEPSFSTESDDVKRCLFYGLGSDGTVGANKNSIKIIGGNTDHYVQGYFVYDSKKSGAQTVSHLRFGKDPIRSTYLIGEANFVACHQWQFLDKFDVLERAGRGAVFLVNAPFAPEHVWRELPRELQQEIIDKDIQLYAIDAYKVAADAGMGQRINTVMQTCFFAISGVIEADRASAAIKQAIEDSYGKRGRAVIERNMMAVDRALDHLHRIDVPSRAEGTRVRLPVVSSLAPEFVQRVTAPMLAGKGDSLPVSAFAPDGTWPVGTSQWEKRNITRQIPSWDKELCIQCNKCALVCPHAAVRVKVYERDALERAPATFQWTGFRGKDFAGQAYTVQVAPEDCTGCTLCVEVCPARDKSNPRHKALDLVEVAAIRDAERDNYRFFLDLPEVDRTSVSINVKSCQLFEPLFEYSGACAGCGETPYIKLVTQLYGDRMIIANATGCSSIYGGNLPTTPYTTNRDGRGPAWSNSLFEDNAEFGLGMRLAVDHQEARARGLVSAFASVLGDELVDAILQAKADDEAGIAAQRERVVRVREILSSVLAGPDSDLSSHERERAFMLAQMADFLVPKQVWIVGGDGWAYDIGYGGLDHVLASGKDVNILVLDTEVYSNTGGQRSKATPLAASAKFAQSGKDRPKKDLGLLAMAYGDVYVAHIAFGAKDKQTLDALVEAASYPGPSLIIAYSPCIAHGYDLSQGLEQQKKAVSTGYWPLFRFDPRKKNGRVMPLALDSAAPKGKLGDFAYNETRFRLLLHSHPDRAKELMSEAQAYVDQRHLLYRQLAGIS